MSKKEITEEYTLEKKLKKCEVNIHFIIPRNKMKHIFAARDELAKAGIRFDTGGGPPGYDPVGLDWEFDWSLTGGAKVYFKKFIK